MKQCTQLYSTPDEKKTKPVQIATLSFSIGLLALFCASATLLVWRVSRTRMPNQTTISDVNVSRKTPAEAIELLTAARIQVPEHQVTLTYEQLEVSSSSSELKARYKIEDAVAAAKRNPSDSHGLGGLIADIQYFFTPYSGALQLSYDQEALQAQMQELEKQLDTPARPPQAELKAGKVVVFAGELGKAVDYAQTEQAVTEAAIRQEFTTPAVVVETGTILTPEQVAMVTTEAEKLKGKSLKVSAELFSKRVSDAQLISLLTLSRELESKNTTELLNTWQEEIKRDPQDPVLKIDSATQKVLKFVPPRSGRQLDLAPTRHELRQALEKLLSESDTKTAEVKLAVIEQAPEKSLASTNQLGITERIGFGDSYYAHSIPNRIHNVAITAERVNNVLIMPGEEFSFNKTLGEVSASTGYRSAYVIKNGRTELGDGGGVCQVSTTVFRSVLNAGLDVTLRLPHSYRVSYYELDSKPGVDATVYAGNVDFRFKNDAEHAVLLHTVNDPKKLYMYTELYGTSDGRMTEITDHKTWNYRAPPPTQYIDSAELPPGKLQQVDWSAAGISASFKHIVRDKDGHVRSEKIYTSNYKPWSAKYLRGI